MSSPQAKAAALLAVCKSKIDAASTAVRGYTAVAEAFGPAIAGWAYADHGEEPGQRRSSASARELDVWTPTPASPSMVLAGIPGTGKTSAAARYIAERGGLLLRATSADRWGFGGGSLLDRAAAAHWLLVDDLGDEKTRQGIDNLSTLITMRSTPTLYTTMLPLVVKDERDKGETIARRYGDHVASRLRAGYRRLYKVDREDLRADIAPSLVRYSKAARLVGAAAQLQLVANGVVVGSAEDVLERAARLTGIDPSSSALAAAAEGIEAQAEVTSSMVFQALLELRAREALEPDVNEGTLTWIDELPEGAT